MTNLNTTCVSMLTLLVPCIASLAAQEPRSPAIEDVSHLISYTETAREARIEGLVLFQVVVDPNGRAEVGKVLRGLPHGLTESAKAAIEGTRHRPVATRTVSAVTFSLPPDHPEGLITMPPVGRLDLRPPERKSQPPAPAYTREARQAGVGGAVTLQGFVNERGRIQDVTVVRGLPYGMTNQAIRAFQKVRYKPATLDGEPVLWPVSISFNFSPPASGRRWPRPIDAPGPTTRPPNTPPSQ